MLCCTHYLAYLWHKLLGAGRESGIKEAFGDILYGGGRGVCHVLGLEAIVAKVVHENFVRWEVANVVVAFGELFDGKTQCRLA